MELYLAIGVIFMKRGQEAIEYLMMLAVVLTIILVAIGLLGWFPAFAGGISERESKTYWRASEPFAIADYKMNGTTATLVTRNMAAEKITLQTIRFDGNSINVAVTSFNPGETKTINGTLTSTCTSGTRFSYEVEITYDTPYLTGKKQIGGRPLVGNCI